MPKKNPLQIITPKARASYANVFKPRLNDESGKMEYSIMLLIPKDGAKTKKFLADLKAASDAALKKKFGDKIPSKNRMNKWLKDGDDDDDLSDAMLKKENRGIYEGNWIMNIKSYDKFPIVDLDREEILDSGEFKSGDYCRVSANGFGYDVKGNKGVSFWFNSLQVLGKGEPLGGGGSNPDDDYDDDEYQDEDDDMYGDD